MPLRNNYLVVFSFSFPRGIRGHLFYFASRVFRTDTVYRGTTQEQLSFNSWVLALPLLWDAAS